MDRAAAQSPAIPLRGVRAVLFDVGNTLSHLDYGFLAERIRRFAPGVTPDGVGRADALVRRYGWEPGPGAPVRRTGFFPAYVGAICEWAGLSETAGLQVAAAAEWEHRARPSGLWNRVDPEAAAVLGALAERGVRLGVVSNADGRVEDQLRLFGLREHFEVVVDSDRAGVAKPDPRIFHLALAQMGLPPDEAVYVGDIMDVDVDGAERAGMRGVLYDRWSVWTDTGTPRVTRLGHLVGILGTRDGADHPLTGTARPGRERTRCLKRAAASRLVLRQRRNERQSTAFVRRSG